MDILKFLLIAIIGYALGNLSIGLFVSHSMAKIDIREHGSGGTGATNILRTLGWLPSVMTLLGDAAKAVLAGLIGKWIMGPENAIIGAQVGGVFAVIGHNWPAAFRFKGGRGIAASFGAILVLDWPIALALLGIEIVMVAATRYVSVASITAAISYVILTAIFRSGDWGMLIYSIIICALAVYSHRGNIQRLRNHSENRLDFSKINKLSRRKK